MNNAFAFPFDSERNALGLEDREYYSEDMRNYFSKFVANGIFGQNTMELQVLSTSGMGIKITAGSCFINGAVKELPDTQFTLELGDSEYSRIDAVVLRFDLLQRDIIPMIIKGVPSAAPETPIPVRDNNTWDLLLAYISVGWNSISISQADVSDKRGSEWCPYVTGLVRFIDSSGLFAQYEAAWADFVAQLGESDKVTIDTVDPRTRNDTLAMKAQMPYSISGLLKI